MTVFLMIIHIVISALLILSILVQSSKGGSLDGLVGGAATSALGGQGANKFMKQVTIVLAVLFTASCLVFAISLNHEGPSSSKAVDILKKDVEKTKAAQQVEQPKAVEQVDKSEAIPTDNVDK